ncbi:MAG TPA: LuxR C-terminal-related transcriptional regulator [Gammaproteobacteria bacterium]|nr:LuxR C-terminal-related transcriptional regulator [Gammaproteobacteria bacterium]
MGKKAVTILLVGDCALARAGIRRVLDDEPEFTVVAETDTPTEAMRLARSKPPRVVVLDVNPPCVSALDSARKFVRQCPSAALIVLTPTVDDLLPGRLLQFGVAGYLTKHCSAQELIDAIREVIEGNRYINAELARRLAMDRLPGNRRRSPFAALSHRELQVMLLVAQGKNAREISSWLSLSPKTVNTYRQRLLGKLGVRSEVELTHLAVRHGVIDIARCG